MSPVDFYGKPFSSRLLIGTALYPSPAIMQQAIRASGAEIVTVSLRRESSGGRIGNAFWDLIRELGVGVLPNTAGCRSVREAVTTARAGARTVRDALDQARSHRRRRDAAARRGRPGRSGGDPDQGRLPGISLLHRGPDGGAAAARSRLPRHHAVGGADRQRARHRQPRRAQAVARAAARGDAGGRRRARARRRTPPTRSNSATTPCCSIPRSPRPAIRSPWPKPSAWRSKPAASPMKRA